MVGGLQAGSPTSVRPCTVSTLGVPGMRYVQNRRAG